MKGRITQYQQGSFSPQAVGTPGVNRSGMILAKGIESFGRALAERQDTSDNLTAMNQFGEYQIQYSQKKLELQRQYQNDPMEYVTAVRDMSNVLSDDMSKNMSHGASRRFKTLVTNASIRDTQANATWAFKRDSEIQVGKIKSIKQNIALKASSVASAQELAEIRGDFAAVSPEAQKFITKEDDDKLTKKYWELARTNAANAQLMYRPNQFKADLDGHAYDGILDPDEIVSFSKKAQTAIENRGIDDLYRTIHFAESKSLEWVKNIDNRTASISDLVIERDAITNKWKQEKNPKQKEVLKAYLNNLDALVAGQTRSIQRTELGKARREAVLDSFNREWDTYLTKKSNAGEQPGEGDLTEQLRLVSRLNDAYNQGIIDRNELFDRISVLSTKHEISKNAIGGSLPFDEAINQAGAASGFWLFRKGDDEVSKGYRAIRENVDREYPELTDEERLVLKAQLMSQYNKKLQQMPPEQLKELKTDPQKDKAVHQILIGGMSSAGESIPGLLRVSSFFRDKITGIDYRIGDYRQDQLGNTLFFKGKEADGSPIWRFKPGSIINGAGGTKYRANADGLPERI